MPPINQFECECGSKYETQLDPTTNVDEYHGEPEIAQLPCPKCGAVSQPVFFIEVMPGIAVFNCPCGNTFKTQPDRKTRVDAYYTK